MVSTLLENPLFNICFFVGLLFVFVGFVMFQFPPKNINYLYGYRTISSMKSQERWNFAQRFSAEEMMRLGAFLIFTSLLALIINFEESVNLIIGLSLVIVMVIILFLRVENAIKKKFH